MNVYYRLTPEVRDLLLHSCDNNEQVAATLPIPAYLCSVSNVSSMKATRHERFANVATTSSKMNDDGDGSNEYDDDNINSDLLALTLNSDSDDDDNSSSSSSSSSSNESQQDVDVVKSELAENQYSILYHILNAKTASFVTPRVQKVDDKNINFKQPEPKILCDAIVDIELSECKCMNIFTYIFHINLVYI